MDIRKEAVRVNRATGKEGWGKDKRKGRDKRGRGLRDRRGLENSSRSLR